MTDIAPAEAPPLSLFQRVIGVITSPTATFRSVVAHPRPFGVLLICGLVIGVMGSLPQMTDAGRQAVLDAQVRGIERFGATVTPEMYEKMQASAQNPVSQAFGMLSGLIMLPIFALIFSGVFYVVFSAILGGVASFKQVLAVVAHSYVISALGVALGAPIQMMQSTFSFAGPFTLSALAPGLSSESTLAMFLGAVSVFSLWSFFVNGLGLGVLYRRSGSAIGMMLVVLFLVFMFAVVSLFGAFFSRS